MIKYIFNKQPKQKFWLWCLSVACLASLMNPQIAGAYSTPVGLSLSAGTLGVGTSVTYNIENRYGVRIAVNSYEFDKKIKHQGVTFDSTIELEGLSGTLDWYPWSSGARLSAGLISNSSKATATPYAYNLTMNINEVEVNLSDAGFTEVEITFSPVSTYFGVGWGNAGRGEGLSLFTDIGVVLQGAPNVSLSVENQASLGLTEADIRAQEKSYEDELKSLRLYPVITIGFSYNL